MKLITIKQKINFLSIHNLFFHFIFIKRQHLNKPSEMLSSILLKQLNFTFARNLHKPHLKKYFERKADNAYKAKQDLEAKLQIPKMSEKLFRRVFKSQPKIFVPDNDVNKNFEARVKFVKDLAQKYELAKAMQSCIYSNRYILFKMTNERLEEICKAVESNYGFTKEQINTVFTNFNRTINPKLPEILDQKIELFHDYLHFTKEETVQLLAKHPFLIPASTQRIKETILLLISESKSLGDEILSRDRIRQLLNEFPEMFILGRHQIKDLIKVYQDWGFEYKEVWQLILDSPILLNNYPFQVMPLKRKLFRYFNFTKEMGRLMIKQYPLVLMSSVSSLEAKLIFIKDRLKLPIGQETLELLQYKFSTIRPRGELLVRAKQTITLENIIGYVTMSDEEFAKKLQIPLERVIEEKQRFKETAEVDWRRRKVLKGSGVEEKVKGILQGMRQELEQQTATA